ncbi:MAG: AMP-binding protein [Gammaproteobacteria bacterium]|nr:AMP-binding protein [Gammaproteobacteria bacterium]
MSVHDLSLYDVLVRNARCFAERTAVVTESGHSRSYHELLERVDRLAAGLAAGGLGKGDRVVVLAQNCAAFYELYFACARQGVVPYPLNWRLSADEIARSLERADARAIVCDEQYLSVLPHDLSAFALKAQFDGVPQGNWCSVESLYAHGPAAARPDVGFDDGFAIISTAAVDVIPRGAVLTHGNILMSNMQTIAAMGLDERDGNLVALPLFHVAALGSALSVMHAGGQIVIMPSYDPGKAVQLIDEHGLTFISDFPPVLTTLLDEAEAQSSRLPSLRVVNGIDAPDTIERLHKVTDADFFAGFGQTETSGWITIQRARDLMGAAGKPGPLCEVRLVDDYDQEVPVGSPGEIVARGPLIFQGYFGQPEVTEHTFRGGWHHTGDVGRFDETGTLYYVKRKPEKELIKPGGENVYPAEVETVIMDMDGVRGVCVFGVPDAKWGEAIKAVVETDASLTAEQVRDFVGSRIARFKRPQHVLFSSDLPRDDTGSVDREAVKERWAEA